MSDLGRDIDALRTQQSQPFCRNADQIQDAMADRIVAEQHPLELSDELAARLADGPFGLLQTLHKTGHIIHATLPSDHDLYPDEDFMVSPYLMNHHDPDTLGAWGIEVQGRLKAQLRSVPVFEEEVPSFSLAVRREDGRYMRAGEQEAEDVVGLLSFVYQHSALEAEKQIPAPRKGVLSHLSSLASKLIHRNS